FHVTGVQTCALPISSSGTDPDGERFEYLGEKLREMNIDIIDEHYYRPPAWFLSGADRYDEYDRNGPKIFAGEYASHTTRPQGPRSEERRVGHSTSQR